MADVNSPVGETVGQRPKRRTRLGSDYYRLFTASAISSVGDGVSTLAFPWLVAAITRDALLVSLVAVAQQLPWLLFSLPAGVITDRLDRRRVMIVTNLIRTLLMVAVAVMVLARQNLLPTDVERVTDGDGDYLLYGTVLAASLLLGMGAVLYDNTAQTIMPSLVRVDQLERANGRLWSAEEAASSFVGPPLGSLLLAVSFMLPFFLDASTFAVSALLVLLITFRTPVPASEPAQRQRWHKELTEGLTWLWRHRLLRSMALILGVVNAAEMMTLSILVLFAQDVLSTNVFEFATLSLAGAVGGVIGGVVAPMISARLGSGPSLWLVLAGGGLAAIAIGLVSNWLIVAVIMIGFALLTVLWNVVTVSLRQAAIPDRLLGRVNSVYRFLAWGTMPIGSLLGGAIVAATQHALGHETALRVPWLVSGVINLAMLVVAIRCLTTAKIEAARENSEPQ